MSLFLFQQKIPFSQVINYLRVFEPGCTTSPDSWAKTQAQDVGVGDLLFVFEPIYSPWSDSSSGIGVAEGDSFNVTAIAIAHKWENGVLAYAVKPDNFERQHLEAYLAQQAHAARQNGTGFYYALARPSTVLAPDVMRDLGELDSFGSSGWRKDDNQPIDILYAFFTAASWGVMVHPGQQPDIAQIGYGLFCDKEPAPGSNSPDLRQHVEPVEKGQLPQAQRPVADLSVPEPEQEVVPAPAPKQMSLPKMPSFFKQSKPAAEARGKTPRIIAPGSAGAVPPLPSAIEPEAAPSEPYYEEPLPTAPAVQESSLTEPVPALTPSDLAALAPNMPASNVPPLPGQSMPPPPLPAAEPAPPPASAPAFMAPPENSMPAFSDGQSSPPLAADPWGLADQSEELPTPDQSPALSAPGAVTDIPSLAELLGNIGRSADAADVVAPPAIPSPEAAVPEADVTIVNAGPPTKRKAEPERELKNPVIKEPITVKSGVAGLVSKLEQQASKASTRLESQVDDIQSRLSDELGELMAKVNSAETRNVRNAQDLRADLTERMEKTAGDVVGKVSVSSKDGAQKVRQHQTDGVAQLDEKHEYVKTSLNSSFDEVRARAEAIAKTFQESLTTQSTSSLSELDQLRNEMSDQLSGLFGHYETALQTVFDNFRERLTASNAAVSTTVEGRYTLLQGQLAELQARSMSRLEQLRYSYLNQLSKQFIVTRAEVRKMRASALEEMIIPKLRAHREELRAVTTEFQTKLSEDLDQKGQEKLAEFEPILIEKKQKLAEVLHSTAAVKDALEEQLRGRLQKVADELKQFVEAAVQQAQTAYKSTEEQLAEIDRAVRALADPSSIEGDLELLNERNQVLSAMDDATEKAKDEVLGTLRSSLASLEEKGKQLQEELISSMEEDAYRVRRASEQSLNNIREAIKEAFKAIQAAQDERMPM